MFDYYKINTLGLPQFQVDETYKRNYFLPVLLTKVNQITYLVDRFLSELFLTQRELEKVFASCSVNVQLVNKFNTVGVKQ